MLRRDTDARLYADQVDGQRHYWFVTGTVTGDPLQLELGESDYDAVLSLLPGFICEMLSDARTHRTWYRYRDEFWVDDTGRSPRHVASLVDKILWGEHGSRGAA